MSRINIIKNNKKTANTIEVTSIGDINIDMITSNIKNMPPKDSQVIIDNIVMTSGGCAANFAKAISKLGLKTRFIGKIGDDMYGRFLKNTLSDIDLKLSVGTKTGITYAITFDDGTRSFITYPGSNGELTIDDINLNLIEGRFVHIASFFLQGLREKTSKILKYAHKRGMITSFDTGWDPRGWKKRDKELIVDLLKYVDIFFPNISEARAIVPDIKNIYDICDRLIALGTRIVALKMGSEGSLIVTKDRHIFIKPFGVNVVDTTGAGDVFDAGFIFGQYMGWDIKKSGIFANAAAALSTRYYGSEGYPTEFEVEEFMKSSL